MGIVLHRLAYYRQARLGAFYGPIFALLEGFALGGISASFELKYPGIVMFGVSLTIALMFAMLLLYGLGAFKVTNRYLTGMLSALLAICVIYAATCLLRYFGYTIPYIHESGPIGIGFSLFVVAVATLFFIVDFYMIEQGVELGAPKWMEWYAAFGLVLGLVWLYLEVLRLIARARDFQSTYLSES